MSEILVSICCVTYNHKNYIRECLDGFMMQKCNFKFEVLIHDDASTDGTSDIIREYVVKYPDIIKPIIQTENQYSKGVKISFTYNFPRAKGKYIAMCEGDDYWTDPYKLQKQVDFLEAHPDYSMCCHNAERVVAGKVIGITTNVETDTDLSVPEIIIKGGGYISTNSILYVRNLVVPYIEEFSSGCSVGDYPLQMLCSLKGKVRCFSTIMSAYRVDAVGSWSNTKRSVEYYIKFHEDRNNWLRHVDKITDCKYEKIFSYVIGSNNMQLAMLKRKYKYLQKDSDFKYFFKKQSFQNKILILLRIGLRSVRGNIK